MNKKIKLKKNLSKTASSTMKELNNFLFIKSSFILLFLFLIITVNTAVANNYSELTSSSNVISVTDDEIGISELYAPIDDATQTIENNEVPSTSPEIPAGQVLSKEDEVLGLKKFYVEMTNDEDENKQDFEISFSQVIQEDAVVNKPVHWYQEVKLKNNADKDLELTINIANYEEVPKNLLSEASNIGVYYHIDKISETPVFNVKLGAGEEASITIKYETPAIKPEINCHKMVLEEIIPPDAEIISSDIPLKQIIGETCDLTLLFPKNMVYHNIELDINDLNLGNKKISSVINPVTNELIKLKGDKIIIP